MLNLFPDIRSAAQRIHPYVLETPVIPALHLSRETGAQVYLKMESEQYTNSFKIRGAVNKLLSLNTEAHSSHEDTGLSVVTASTGNHAQGVARALGMTDIKGTIFLPENPEPSKLAALKHYDVDLEQYGKDSLETELHAKQVAEERGAVWISPYNDPDIIAGQGTIGLELKEQLNTIDDVLVTVGGGGLISGIATCLSCISPQTRIIGCQPENAPDMFRCIEAGEIISIKQRDTLSDGSAGGVEPGAITFPICSALVNEYVLVSEDEIKCAMRLIIDQHHKIIEGAAAVAVAAFLKRQEQFRGRTVVIILCGGNISSDKLKAVLV